MINLMDFAPENESRYDRHNLIQWWNQDKLKQAKIIVAGVGALGNEVLKNLALLGVGNLTLIDFDLISITNLTRSILFREKDVNLPKVEVAKQRLLEINPELNITTINGDLEFDLRLGFIQKHDLIIGCLDSINARWAINQLAYRGGIPWINGGIGVGEGEVSFFDPKTDQACYECSISPQMWERRNKRYSCQGMKRDFPPEAMATTAPLASLVGAMEVQQALLYLHGDDSFLKSGEKVFLSLKPWISFKVTIQRQKHCLAHDFQDIPLVKLEYDGNLTVKNLLQIIEGQGYKDPVLWLNNEILRQMTCLNSGCNLIEIINKPLRQYVESNLICPKCHQIRDIEIIESLSLESCQNKITLKELDILNNDILYFETQKGKIKIHFY
jgi:molybdopterin/thiamine biosynthesis adenylyltransferase